jgi:hypothetical protein
MFALFRISLFSHHIKVIEPLLDLLCDPDELFELLITALSDDEPSSPSTATAQPSASAVSASAR